MTEQGVIGKDTPCIVCGGNAEKGRTLSGTTPITEPGYRACSFRVCKQCLRDPRIAAEKLTAKVGRLKASLEFLEIIVVPGVNGLAADHRLRINE
jgi:hypothetical protein